MPCPSCNSEEWKLASLVYKEGLSHIATTTVGAGAGPGAFGGGGAKTTGTQQSALSKAAAPPNGYVFTILLSVAMIISALFALLGSGFWWLIVACFVGGIAAVYPGEHAKHTEAMSRWHATRMCQRCGTFYSAT